MALVPAFPMGMELAELEAPEAIALARDLVAREGPGAVSAIKDLYAKYKYSKEVIQWLKDNKIFVPPKKKRKMRNRRQTPKPIEYPVRSIPPPTMAPGKSRKRSKSTTIARSGVQKQRVKTTKATRSRKRTKSSRAKINKLAKDVRVIKKNQPKSSKRFYQTTGFIKMPPAALQGGAVIYEIVGLNRFILDDPLTNLRFGNTNETWTAIDGASIMLKNIYIENIITNAVTANCHLEYMWVKAKADTGNRYLDNMKARATDMQDPITAVVAGPVTATATASDIPASLQLLPHEVPIPITSGFLDPNSNWTQVGKVHKVSLHPGDSFKITHSIKRIKWDQEKDEAAANYAKNWTYHLVVKMVGGLGHDQTSTNFVTRMMPACDIFRRRQWDVVYFGGSGVHDISRSTGIDADQSGKVAVQADNFNSAVEPATGAPSTTSV